MSKHSSAVSQPISPDGATAVRGIHWPRLYDVLLKAMTRGRDRRYREAIIDLMGLAPGSHLLDIGCGTGTQAIAAMRRVLPGGSVTGVDVSAEMLAAAHGKARRAGLAMAFLQGDAADLPFEDEQFDVVTLTTVMHMVPQRRRERCLREAWRVLKPGGRVLLIDYVGEPAARRGLIARHGVHGRFDLDRLRAPLAQAGFGAVDSGPLGWLSLGFLRGTRTQSNRAPIALSRA